MRQLIIILFIVSSSVAKAQVLEDSLANRLYSEIKKEKVISHKFVGCYGTLSASYKKIDSLRSILGTDKFISLIDEDSYILKYWAYITLLQQNDSLAFVYLKQQIKNDTLLSVQNAGNKLLEEYKFNELLIDWYLCVIHLKYKEGISGTINSVVIISNDKNLKKWKRMNAMIYELIESSNINITAKKINCLEY